ncbi:hypothetical protein EDB81DRAFT_25965 [Dactylonectria macrodidyma]|uniref:Uncharacterized protein n=1 Tax=Dactylonectria macrodidyma TaxID=307937 RepID=A0A9P9FT86_9HYPO|nr:hypothetical protein EDB81DRAFT_25965 [Dactylonectria macrodidyma]
MSVSCYRCSETPLKPISERQIQHWGTRERWDRRLLALVPALMLLYPDPDQSLGGTRGVGAGAAVMALVRDALVCCWLAGKPANLVTLLGRAVMKITATRFAAGTKRTLPNRLGGLEIQQREYVSSLRVVLSEMRHECLYVLRLCAHGGLLRWCGGPPYIPNSSSPQLSGFFFHLFTTSTKVLLLTTSHHHPLSSKFFLVASFLTKTPN